MTATDVSRRSVTRRDLLATLPVVGATAAVGGGTIPPVPVVETGPTIELGARVAGWVGVEPTSIDGETNPTLRLVDGRTYTVRWENYDDAPHDLVVENAAGEAVVRTARREDRGETATVSFTATSDLRRYVCSVHPETMAGTVLVGPEAAVARGGLTATMDGPPPVDDETETASEGSVVLSFSPAGTADYRVELQNLVQVTQVVVREQSPAAVGPDLVPLLRFAESPDGRAGGDPVDVPADDQLVRTGVVTDEDAVTQLAENPGDYEVVVHTVDFPAGQLRGSFVEVDALELFTVCVENVATPDAFPVPGVGDLTVALSPLAFAVYGGQDSNTDPVTDNPLFVRDLPQQGHGLEALAEDGDPSALAEALAGRVPEVGTVTVPAGRDEAGPIRPGEAYSFVVPGRPGQRLALALKLLETNDVFYGTARGLPLFGDRETPFASDATRFLAAWDAGVEENERPGTSPNQPPRQTAPDTGPEERASIRRADQVSDDVTYPAAEAVLRVTVRPYVTDGCG